MFFDFDSMLQGEDAQCSRLRVDLLLVLLSLLVLVLQY